MGSIVGRGVRVEVSKTEGAAKTVTAVTQAKPGVATSVGHGLLAKSLGYFVGVTGMVQLEGQAVRIASVTTDTFTLERINTTNYAAFTGGTFVPITAWSTLARTTGYTIGGGAADKQDDTVLLDEVKQELSGLLAAQTVGLNIRNETINGEAADLVEDAARQSAYLVGRITLKTGDVRVWRGQPSIPGEDVQVGGTGTGSFDFTVKGFVNQGAA